MKWVPHAVIPVRTTILLSQYCHLLPKVTLQKLIHCYNTWRSQTRNPGKAGITEDRQVRQAQRCLFCFTCLPDLSESCRASNTINYRRRFSSPALFKASNWTSCYQKWVCYTQLQKILLFVHSNIKCVLPLRYLSATKKSITSLSFSKASYVFICNGKDYFKCLPLLHNNLKLQKSKEYLPQD